MSPVLHALGRALLPLLFIISGINKFMNIPGTAAYIGPNRFPAIPQIEQALGMNTPTILAWLTASVETFGGLLVLIGLFTRSAATLLFLLTGPRSSISITSGRWPTPRRWPRSRLRR